MSASWLKDTYRLIVWTRRLDPWKVAGNGVFNHASLKFSLENSIQLWCVIYMTSNIFLEVCPNFNKFPAVIFASSLFFLQFRPLNPKFLKESLKKTYESSNLQGDCVGLGYLHPSVIDGHLLEQESCGHLRQFGWGPGLAKSGTLVAGIWRWRRYFTPPRTKQGTEWKNGVPKIFFMPRLAFCIFFVAS